MQIRRCPRNRESILDLGFLILDCNPKSAIKNPKSNQSGTRCIFLVIEPFCVWAEKENMKLFSLIFVLFTASVAAFGQEGAGLRGVIRVGGQPAAGATISVSGPVGRGQQVTETRTADADGKYYVGFEDGGKYTVKVTLESNGRRYESDLKEPIELKFANEIKLDIDLVEVGFIRETVTVAADTSQLVEQVSKSVDSISGQEMRDRADITLVDSLRTIPGFRVQQSGGFGRIASIKSRGLRNQDTAILIDGIRFRDATAISGDATSFLSDFTLTNVSEVEVLRGSGSSLYGTNAIGGTVDFKSPTARQGTHGQVGGAFGGLGMGRFRGNISHGADLFGISAGVSRTAYTKGIDEQDNAPNTNLHTRFDVTPTPSLALSGRFYFSDANVRLNVSPDTFGTLPTNTSTIIDANAGVNFAPDANDPDNVQKSRAFTGQFSGYYSFNSQFLIAGHFQSLKTKRRNDDGPLGPGFQSAYASTYDGLINTGNIRGVYTPNDTNTLTVGYEFEAEKFANDNFNATGTSTSNVLDRQRSHTFFVRDDASFFDRTLNLSGGIRYQSFSLDTPTCAPAVCPTAFNNISSPPSAVIADGSAAYFFKRSGTKIRAHVGNGYRVPSLYERFGSYFFFGAFSPLGNPQLEPEKSVAFDGGIDQYLANDRVKLSATYFYTEIKDEITYIPTDDFSAPAYYNFDKHFSRGLEFSSTLRPTTSTDIFVSYTFTNGDIRNFTRPTFPVGPVRSRDRKVYGVPDHQFTLSATQRYKQFWVNFDLLATSSYLAPIFSNSTFSTYTYRFNGNRRGDLTAGYTFQFSRRKLSARVFGTVENVFNQEYYENGFRTAKANARAGVSFAF